VPAVSLSEVKAQVKTILASGVLSPSSRQAHLLQYLCNKALLGEADEIKETTIAVEVFGKSWDYDERKDAIVRVEAYRLRKKLARYYSEKGANDRIRITLSPGGYVPEFLALDADGGPPAPPESPQPQGRKRRAVIAVLVSLAILAVLAVLFLVWRGRPAVRNAHPAASGAAGIRGVPQADAVRILAGSLTKRYIDRFGMEWGSDRHFSGGTVAAGPKDFYGRPPDAGLFRTMRYGEFSYDIPLRPGVYELRLYFAEPEYRSGVEGGGENQRKFSVTLNGSRLLLDQFDIVSDSGISAVDVRCFRDISPAADGLLHLKFTPVRDNAVLNALEIVPGLPGRMWPIRMRASDLSFTDHEGNIWQPDNYYVGGRLASHTDLVGGTPDPGLYAGERYGNFHYAVPVAPGSYTVNLYFAETWYGPQGDGPQKGGPGTRVFSVFCNGLVLIPDLDIIREVGPLRALKRSFRGVRPNGQGKIFLSFSPDRDYASVKAIEILDEGAGSKPSR